VEAEFRAEVRDEIAFLEQRLAVAGKLAHVAVEHRERAMVVVEERRVVRRLLEPALVHAAQRGLGILSRRFLQHRIEAREKLARGPAPTEPEVVGELLEAS